MYWYLQVHLHRDLILTPTTIPFIRRTQNRYCNVPVVSDAFLLLKEDFILYLENNKISFSKPLFNDCWIKRWDDFQVFFYLFFVYDLFHKVHVNIRFHNFIFSTPCQSLDIVISTKKIIRRRVWQTKDTIKDKTRKNYLINYNLR